MGVVWTVSAAADKRIVVPIAKVGDGGEVAAVIPGERELLYMLLMNAGFIIWNLLKDAWAAHKKKSDHSATDIAELKTNMQTVLQTVSAMSKKLENVPSEKEVELKIYQIIANRSKQV